MFGWIKRAAQAAWSGIKAAGRWIGTKLGILKDHEEERRKIEQQRQEYTPANVITPYITPYTTAPSREPVKNSLLPHLPYWASPTLQLGQQRNRKFSWGF